MEPIRGMANITNNGNVNIMDSNTCIDNLVDNLIDNNNLEKVENNTYKQGKIINNKKYIQSMGRKNKNNANVEATTVKHDIKYDIRGDNTHILKNDITSVSLNNIDKAADKYDKIKIEKYLKVLDAIQNEANMKRAKKHTDKTLDPTTNNDNTDVGNIMNDMSNMNNVNNVININDEDKNENENNESEDSSVGTLENLSEIKDVLKTVAQIVKQIPQTPTVYTESNRHKNFSFETSEYGNIYREMVEAHDKKVKITQTFVRTFLRKILNDIKDTQNEKMPRSINIDTLVKGITDGLPKIMEMDQFYSYVSEYLVAKSSQHYYYDTLAARIAINRLHNITTSDFLKTATLLQSNVDKNNDKSPILADDIYDIIVRHHTKLQEAIKYERDYIFDYFGIKTLERSYLYKLHFTKFKIIERPQHMIMRVALGIHGEDIDSAIETYDLISQKYFTHATPTLFNSGTRRPQMSSCFLQAIDDSIESIFDAIRDIAYTSKWSGGIGVHLSGLRARNSLIRGTNGLASGIIPLCVLLNKLAKYINQGGKRNGSISCYLEPHHPDIFDFCDLRKNTGNDDNRARDLYLALWIPSLFMERVKNDEMWSLMCPDECPGLNQVYGKDFVKLYEKYESEGRYVKRVKAQELWVHILGAQSETGFPYMLYKDNANAKSNQKNIGTIRSSNLCAEIIQYSDENETAVCNLSSICLPMYIITDERGNKSFDYDKLMKVCRVAVRNLDKIIDKNYYPTEKTKRSNMRHRPMGIGVQGLVDVYNIMGYGFSSPEAYDLNERIFESIYYACMDESKELSKRFGAYSTFKGSPASQGQLQYHMWGFKDEDLKMGYDWKKLVEEIKKYGLRNSLTTALMPTASTSQIMGNSECIEPYMSNIFKRSTLAGEFIVVNKNLMKDLLACGLWNDDMRKRLIIENGSIQNIESIPDNIKKVYETAFEIKQMHIVNQSAARGKFIDQSQSLNLFMPEPNFDILTSALFNGHDLGLKTGMYYYRSLPAINPINFGIDVDDIKRLTGKDVTIEMLKGNYFKDETTNEKNKPEINTNMNTNTNTLPNDIKNTNIAVAPKLKEVCDWKPGMKLEDCLECGS